MAASPISAPCPFCPTEPELPCAECGRRGVVEPMPEAPPGFKWEDTRQSYWDAVRADMAARGGYGAPYDPENRP